MSFRLVALGVALILWASILGRKDSTMTQDFPLQILLGPNIEADKRLPTSVRLEIAGPRVALKRVNQMNNPIYTVDLTTARAGRQVVHLSRDGLSLPIGARVISVDPSEFVVELRITTPAEKRE